MQKLKVMTIVGTRPEIIRLSRVIHELDLHCDHTLVHTGQNYDYELNEIFFTEMRIRKPDVFLEAAGATATETIGKIIIATGEALLEGVPDALLLLGDTNSSLAAISAKRLKIPIFHMEAGNRCFDFRVPEEINRRIVDHTSDINLTYSNIARDYLLREGLPADQIICTGSPMREVLEYYADDIAASTVLEKQDIESGNYFLVSAHREENVDDPAQLARLFNVLDGLGDTYGIPVIVSMHPRTRKRIEELKITAHPLVRFLKPFGFFDYVQLQKNARCVLSDSGTITEESSILNYPALNLREMHERPEGFEEAAVMFVGLNMDRVIQCLNILGTRSAGDTVPHKIVNDYQPSDVSRKVVRIIHSYTDFVNQKVWHKLPVT
jgi:UDP-N-acetylglucosamine 2-epimerase (non-hydrolysing)